MSEPDIKWIQALLDAAKALVETAETAARNRKGLGGANFYADQFHRQLLTLAPLQKRFLRCVEGLDAAKVDEAVRALAPICSEEKLGHKRKQALRNLALFAHGFLIPALEAGAGPPAPLGELVLPKGVVTPAGKQYLVNIVIQANACYEARCFDACAVMVRKLVESLIIELYEAAKRDAEIKHTGGDFFMLGDLVQTLLGSPHWNLTRDTKATLPKLKALGDRSAHTRRYLASKGDVDGVIPGLRVVVDDLLHLAGLK